MADYPFKINIQTKNGSKFSYFTASFATDATGALSASAVSHRLLHSGLRAVQYTESIDTPSDNVSADEFGHEDGGRVFISSSFSHPNTGSITFTDTETAVSGGLDHYLFYGTKVCSVLGLPEGIKIRPENFRFSDDDNNPDNYMSGDLISDSIQLKQGFKMAPQARMQSNLVWDDLNGEGFIQWVSGSKTRAFMGYDAARDFYSLLVSQITSSIVKATTFTGTLSGNASSATTTTNLSGGTITLGSGGVVRSRQVDDGDALILSSSRAYFADGGDVILQAGNNHGGIGDASTPTRGGHIIARPGRTNLPVGITTEAGSGARSSGSFIVSGSGEFTHNLSVNFTGSFAHSVIAENGAGGQMIAHKWGSADEYVALRGSTTAANHYGVLFSTAGSNDGTTFISAKDGSPVKIRGGGNDNGNEIIVYDSGTTNRIDYDTATNYFNGALGVGTSSHPTTAGLIRASNDVVAFYSSDKRLKDNLIKIGNPLDKISQLNGYEFDWIPKEGIHENEGHDVGVIAQEVEKVLPEIVQTRESGYKAVKYEKIVPLLIESIKELTKRVEELENGSSK